MKGMDFFCSSPASTAISSSMVRRGHNPHHLHDRRKGQSQSHNLHVPCSSHHLPISPRSYYDQKSRKSCARQSDLHRKSPADVQDLSSPTGSSRYLLSDKPFINLLSESEHHVSALVPSTDQAHDAKPSHQSSNNLSPALKSSHSARSRDHHQQVVVLRVSIHCKGCEGKVRKHISKMEGVTSFRIDLATKKVTIVGDVTPLGVLTSVSKVKSAQLWPSSTSSSSSPPPSPWSA